jgi:hypothetical protein
LGVGELVGIRNSTEEGDLAGAELPPVIDFVDLVEGEECGEEECGGGGEEGPAAGCVGWARGR